MAYNIEHVGERIVTVRLMPPITANEASTFKGEMVNTVNRVKGGSLVVVDLRQTDLFPPHVMNQYVDLMRRVNGHFIRSVFWTNDKGLHSAQVDRMVKEANNASRRVYHAAADIDSWFGEVANPTEKRLLHKYLFANAAVAKPA